MVILEDTRQKAEKHTIKHAKWQAHGDTLTRCALPCGDYTLPSPVYIDTKANMQEIAQNIGGTEKEHARFRRELILARDIGTKLYVLVENEEGIRDLNGVACWVNPRLIESPRAITGQRLARAMETMQERYGVTFLFCHPEQAAGVIWSILERYQKERDG